MKKINSTSHMYKSKILLVIIFFFSMTFAYAQQTARQTDGNIGYLEYLPSDYGVDSTRNYPILFFLHGLGERGDVFPDDLERVKKHGPPKHIENGHNMCFDIDGVEECFIVISPQLDEVNVHWPPEYIDDVVEHARTYLRIDESRMYVSGLSMGGGGTWYYSQDYPNKIAAAAPICGNRNLPELACNIADAELPIWAFHGDADSTIHVSETINMVNAIKSCNPENDSLVTMTIYPGVEHNSWGRAYKTDNSQHTPNLYEWLLSHSLEDEVIDTLQVPTSLQANLGLSSSVIELSWDDNSTNETNFELQRSISGSSFTTLVILDQNDTSYFDGDLSAGVDYQYQIRALGILDTSLFSISNVVTTPLLSSGIEDVEWTDLVGALVAGDTLISTASYGWDNSGAASIQEIPANTDGWLEVVIQDVPPNNGKVIGLSSINIDESPTTINYGLEIYGQNVAAYENGSRIGYMGKHYPGDTLRIAREDSVVSYLINGEVKRISSIISTTSLIADIAFKHETSNVFDARILTVSPEYIPLDAPSGLEVVVTSSTSTVLTWSDNSSTETGFELQQSIAGGPFTFLAWLSADSTYYEDYGLSPTTEYLYQIRALNDTDTSAFDVSPIVITPDVVSGIQNIEWTDLVGTSVSGDSLISIADYGWGNSGAASVQEIPANTDGWLEVIVLNGSTNNGKVIGLSTTNIDENKTSINYGLEIYGQNIAAYENGSRVGYMGKKYIGDTLRIERTGTVISYLVNGEVKRTSSVASNTSLVADVSFNHMEGIVFSARMYSDDTQASARVTEISPQEPSLLNILAYPNPTEGTLNITGLPSDSFTFYMYDMSGKNYLQEERKFDSDQDIRFDVSFIPSGMYLLHVVGQDGLNVIKFSKH